MKYVLTSGIAASLLLGTAGSVFAVDLTIESWRNDDLSIWQDKIIPAFEAQNPDIHVTFSPIAPTQYDAAVNATIVRSVENAVRVRILTGIENAVVVYILIDGIRNDVVP